MAAIAMISSDIIDKIGHDITRMKLHKLLYYAQAWNLVWNEEPLFFDHIFAEQSGPMVRSIDEIIGGRFKASKYDLEDQCQYGALGYEEADTIKLVLEKYGHMTDQNLSDLPRLEEPWILAKKRNEGNMIELSDMHEYYSGIGINAD